MNAVPLVAVAMLVAVPATVATDEAASEPGKLEAIKTVEFGKNREFRVNGKPFLPVMIWLQGEGQIPKVKACAINTYCAKSSKLSDEKFLELMEKNDLYGILSIDQDSKATAHPRLLGYIQGDEPDMPQKSEGGKFIARKPEEAIAATYANMKRADPSRPVLMTFTAYFMKSQKRKFDEATKQKVYPAFVKHCDAVGFDTYPVYGSGTPGRLHEVADGVTELLAIAGPGKPVYAWIETNKGSRWMTYEKQPDVLPIHTRSETWMALIRGATAIGYFTHSWRPEPYTSFACQPEMIRELNRLNSQLALLAPAILAAPAKLKMTMKPAAADGADLACHFKATQLDGVLNIFAQNIDLGPTPEKYEQFVPIEPRAGKATFTVPGLAAGTRIEVVDENRELAAADGRFSDEFAPLTEHVYKLKL